MGISETTNNSTKPTYNAPAGETHSKPGPTGSSTSTGRKGYGSTDDFGEATATATSAVPPGGPVPPAPGTREGGSKKPHNFTLSKGPAPSNDLILQHDFKPHLRFVITITPNDHEINPKSHAGMNIERYVGLLVQLVEHEDGNHGGLKSVTFSDKKADIEYNDKTARTVGGSNSDDPEDHVKGEKIHEYLGKLRDTLNGLGKGDLKLEVRSAPEKSAGAPEGAPHAASEKAAEDVAEEKAEANKEAQDAGKANKAGAPAAKDPADVKKEQDAFSRDLIGAASADAELSYEKAQQSKRGFRNAKTYQEKAAAVKQLKEHVESFGHSKEDLKAQVAALQTRGVDESERDGIEKEFKSLLEDSEKAHTELSSSADTLSGTLANEVSGELKTSIENFNQNHKLDAATPEAQSDAYKALREWMSGAKEPAEALKTLGVDLPEGFEALEKALEAHQQASANPAA